MSGSGGAAAAAVFDTTGGSPGVKFEDVWVIERVQYSELPRHGLMPLILDALGSHIPVCRVSRVREGRSDPPERDGVHGAVTHSIFFFRLAL